MKQNVLRVRSRGPEELGDRAGAEGEAKKARNLQKVTGTLGTANLIANLAIVAVTAMLAMEGNKSASFALRSRRLP